MWNKFCPLILYYYHSFSLFLHPSFVLTIILSIHYSFSYISNIHVSNPLLSYHQTLQIPEHEFAVHGFRPSCKPLPFPLFSMVKQEIFMMWQSQNSVQMCVKIIVDVLLQSVFKKKKQQQKKPNLRKKKYKSRFNHALR